MFAWTLIPKFILTHESDPESWSSYRLRSGIALIGDPKLIFLDEPTAGVDPYSRRHMWSVLKKRKEGKVRLDTFIVFLSSALFKQICLSPSTFVQIKKWMFWLRSSCPLTRMMKKDLSTKGLSIFVSAPSSHHTGYLKLMIWSCLTK